MAFKSFTYSVQWLWFADGNDTEETGASEPASSSTTVEEPMANGNSDEKEEPVPMSDETAEPMETSS